VLAIIHKDMLLKDQMPSVASALGAKVFEIGYRVRCTSRPEPHNGANLEFTFDVLP
jgi:hypothetical protein